MTAKERMIAYLENNHDSYTGKQMSNLEKAFEDHAKEQRETCGDAVHDYLHEFDYIEHVIGGAVDACLNATGESK